MSQFDIHDLFYALFQKTKHERQGGLQRQNIVTLLNIYYAQEDQSEDQMAG